MVILLTIVLLGFVAAFVTVPLQRREGAEAYKPVDTEDPVLADLEARKEAKYREIKDTEMDHAQGKIGDDEFKRQDRELRAEAIEILRRIDAHLGAPRQPGDETL